MKNTLYIFGILLLIFSSSCKKNNSYQEPVKGIEALRIPLGFQFETIKEINFQVKFPNSIDFSSNKSRLRIFSANPAEGGEELATSSVAPNGIGDIRLNIPSTIQSIFIQSVMGLIEVPLSAGNTKDGPIVIDFGAIVNNEPPTGLDSFKSTLLQSFFTYNGFKSAQSVVNIISNGSFDDDDFGLIPDWSSPMVADGRWHITSTLGYNHAKQHTQASEKMLRKTPSPARYGGVAQLLQANSGDLITFTADIRSNGNNNNTSWLFIIPRNANGSSLNFYSIEIGNTSNKWVTKTVAASMPAGTSSVQILLWSHIYGGAIDYDNVVVTGPVTDSDGDGVDDELDDYPNDPDRAFDYFYPNETDFGTLAFEDLWPGKGDYDFNDLVLDYRYHLVLNADNKIVELFLDNSVRAIGASLENGFGIELDGISPESIASITGTQLTENYIQLNANGTEADQQHAVVILFDNAFSRFGGQTGFGINTVQENEYLKPDTTLIYILFNDPVAYNLTGLAPFNPFLIVDKERGREVHLAGKKPTSLADPSFFGTWFDDTNPFSGKYYQSESNLPWGISLPSKFEYPVEKTDITEAYLHFGAWAESGGAQFPDWYSEESSGYRNSSLIYQKEE